jgi:SAM-dependent methyltransferase
MRLVGTLGRLCCGHEEDRFDRGASLIYPASAIQEDYRMATHPYDDRYFDEIAEGSLSSAKVIVPYLLELLQPKSVLDVGCAEGAWLSVFREAGIVDYLGIDGEHVDRDRLKIEKDKFVATNLENGFSLGRRFDLVVCLEVAEHLAVEAADRLVSSLVTHAPFVVFSASIPFQDGTGHVNEQWPLYWVEKFSRHGYAPLDCIRAKVWRDSRVRWWFAQNMIIYADAGAVEHNARLLQWLGSRSEEPLPLVHPELLIHKEKLLRQRRRQAASPRWLLRQLLNVLASRLRLLN